jgi:hypothetical protein
MDPGKILNRGRSSVREGHHEEALRDFVWFHKHALAHDKAYYGVRLSFALGYWADLAKIYPPALRALQSLKRRGQAKLLRGKGDRCLFHEVESINRELKRTKDTYKLFRAIRKKHPKLAKACADLAIEEIVEAGDFKLASEYLPHPENYLLWLSDQLNERLEQKDAPRRIAVGRREAYVRNYCRDVRTALRILNGLRNRYAAKAGLEWAIALVRPKQARAMVCAQLTSKPRRIH